MSKLSALYPQAIEHTKIKIYEDLDRYLETKEIMPTYEQYIIDRRHYIEQIWINVWLTKVTNDVPKREKKAYLSDSDYEVEGVDRKLINRLFRNEMRTYQPFDTLSWVEETFSQNETEWEERYQRVRNEFLKRKEEELQAEKRSNIRESIEAFAQHLIEEEYDNFYLYVRYHVAKQLANDFENNQKYPAIPPYKIEEKLVEEGPFDPVNYSTLASFFDELTGAVHRKFHWEYETYFYAYEKLINDYIPNLVARTLIKQLSPSLIDQYTIEFNKELSQRALRKMLTIYVNTLESDYFKRIQEEYISDLLELASVPFDLDRHEKIYEEDLEDRERKKAEELAEIERKKAFEERMLEDIFGREYRPSIGRNIQYVLHIGETNTGKTHQALERMKEANSGLYLAPLRLLALEVFDKLNHEGIPCGLKTGEEEKDVEGANHISCTVEMFHEKEYYDIVVIDEAQMIADNDRGFSWFKAITKANAKEVHIIASHNAETMIVELLGDSNIEIYKYYRDIPLEVEGKEFSMKHTRKGDALVCFSRRRVLETASRLQNNGHSVSMIYGSMPPETRKKQMQRFIDGETTVIVATDAIGMGLNLPIRRIVFLENEKFDGTRRRRLTSQEVKQIAGRAGRKGIYDVGKVAFTKDIKRMKRLLYQDDELVSTFAIAPTNSVFERFQKYHRDLGTFFELWNKFESPKGTKKATLSEERELYTMVRGTQIEARLSMMDLYGFLHLPFSTNEPLLTKQWRRAMAAIIKGNELPEPIIKKGSLEEVELSYKAVGLHLLFLYRLDRRTEALYWERVREEISDDVHERLKTDVRNMSKKCRTCGTKLELDFTFAICNDCYASKYKRNDHYYEC
ncbi:DEAD/DEAH box helicase [Alkalihalobacillus sp. BA299]|uniref:DEAD/DEAH box helicase n=1 Tax=Alkalihalobacillus sp. BA299 TaxID=2815938 RepID=UPI001ADAED02|nr:DEAD/DEAH box helicase [Alkalihalobacillus sp. BA299]